MRRHIFIIPTALLLFNIIHADPELCNSEKSRSKRAFGPVDLQATKKAVLAPETISNQLTSAIIFNFIAYPIAYALLGNSFLKM